MQEVQLKRKQVLRKKCGALNITVQLRYFLTAIKYFVYNKNFFAFVK